MAHFAERDNDLPFKGFFLPITLFPKPSDNSEGQDQTCSSKCLQFCVVSLLLSWYTALPSSLYLYTVIFTLPHTVKYLSIPCQSCFAFSLVMEKNGKPGFMLPPTFSLLPATAQNEVWLGRIAGKSNRGIFSAST